MTETILELSGVTFRRGTTQILDGIDLTVGPGEHWALLGPNGAGKSTVPLGRGSTGPCSGRTVPARAPCSGCAER